MPTETTKITTITTKEMRQIIQCARKKDVDAEYISEYVIKDAKFDSIVTYNPLYEIIRTFVDKLDITGDAKRDIESALHVIVANADPEDIEYVLKLITLYTQDEVKVTVNSEDFEKLRDICLQ